MLVLNRRDQQGNVGFPKHAPKQAAITIVFISKTININIGTMLSQLKIYSKTVNMH